MIPSLCAFLGILSYLHSASLADQLSRIDLRQIQIGGEIGRRIKVTIRNNLLVLDADKDFIDPFRRPNREGGFIGLGTFIGSLVRLAAHTGAHRTNVTWIFARNTGSSYRGTLRSWLADGATWKITLYYRTADGLLVNLYTECDAEVALASNVKLTLKQMTDYPNSGKVTFQLTLPRPTEFALQFRIPRWCPILKETTSCSTNSWNDHGCLLSSFIWISHFYSQEFEFPGDLPALQS